MNIMEEDILEIADAHAGYRGMAEAGRNTKIGPVSTDWLKN